MQRLMQNGEPRKAIRHRLGGAILTLLLALLATLVLAPPAFAAPGDLDQSFGIAGKLTTDFSGGNDAASAVAIDSSGRLVVAGESNGDFALARYNANGTLDTSFGTAGTGKVTTDFAGDDDEANALAIDSSGKIVVAGYSDIGSDDDFALARYNANGTLDTGFGTAGTGKVTTGFGSGRGEIAYALAIDSSGKIVLAGSSDEDFALARYNADGALDTGFGTAGTGKVTTDFGSGSNDEANALAIDSAGKIVVAGYSDSGGGYDFALARYTTGGALDTNFGSAGTGKVTTGFGSVSTDEANALAIDSAGKIVVAGQSYTSNSSEFALARYNADGTLDTSFGSDGTGKVGSGSDDKANALAIESSGKIVAAGESYNGNNDDFALARYTTDGALDPSFGSGGTGKVTTSFSLGSEDEANALAIDSSGKIVVAGHSDDDFALARYLTEHTLTVSKPGTGSGSVTSSPAGISCGSSCSHSYDAGTQITLTASAAAGSSFAGWSGGGCTGTSSCTVTLDSNETVSATFTKLTPKPPKTTLTEAKIDGKKNSAKFTFKGNGDVTGFQCALATKPKHGKPKVHFKSCHSPKTYKDLKHGSYTFEVRAKGPGGMDKSPATKSFRLR